MKTGWWLWVVNFFGLSFFFSFTELSVWTQRPHWRSQRQPGQEGTVQPPRPGAATLPAAATCTMPSARRGCLWGPVVPAARQRLGTILTRSSTYGRAFAKVWGCGPWLNRWHLPFSPHCSLRPHSLSAPVSSHVSPSLLRVTPSPSFPCLLVGVVGGVPGPR